MLIKFKFINLKPEDKLSIQILIKISMRFNQLVFYGHVGWLPIGVVHKFINMKVESVRKGKMKQL